jgi:hypothetical protein
MRRRATGVKVRMLGAMSGRGIFGAAAKGRISRAVEMVYLMRNGAPRKKEKGKNTQPRKFHRSATTRKLYGEEGGKVNYLFSRKLRVSCQR